MVYQDRIETNLLQLLAHPEISKVFKCGYFCYYFWGQYCWWTETSISGNDFFYFWLVFIALNSFSAPHTHFAVPVSLDRYFASAKSQLFAVLLFSYFVNCKCFASIAVLCWIGCWLSNKQVLCWLFAHTWLLTLLSYLQYLPITMSPENWLAHWKLGATDTFMRFIIDFAILQIVAKLGLKVMGHVRWKCAMHCLIAKQRQ